jgi:hypothetical protein
MMISRIADGIDGDVNNAGRAKHMVDFQFQTALTGFVNATKLVVEKEEKTIQRTVDYSRIIINLVRPSIDR